MSRGKKRSVAVRFLVVCSGTEPFEVESYDRRATDAVRRALDQKVAGWCKATYYVEIADGTTSEGTLYNN